MTRNALGRLADRSIRNNQEKETTFNNPFELLQTPNELKEDIPAPDSEETNLLLKKGRYFIRKGKNVKRISNFKIIPYYLLKDSSNPKRVFEIKNTAGERVILACPVRTMSRISEFSAMIEGKGNFVLNAGGEDYSILKEYLFSYEDVAEEINTLGYQEDTKYYAFSNAIFDGKSIYKVNDFGIVRGNDRCFYLPAYSKINEGAEREYLNERKFVFKDSSTTFEDWSKNIIDVFGDNGKIGLCFTIAALFRDIVFNTTNCFPHLFLFGSKGTGKTTFRHALCKLFGYGPNDAIGLGGASTTKSFFRKMAQVKNALVAFDEYKNNINPTFLEALKNAYDGIGYERAQMTNNNKTHISQVNSSIIFGGQEMPVKENALFSRTIMLVFAKTKFTNDQKEAFNKLENLISKGLSNVILEIIQHREIVENCFELEYKKAYQHFRRNKATSHFEERTLTNIASILGVYNILSNRLKFPFKRNDLYGTFEKNMISQQKQINSTNEVNEFWKIIEFLIQDNWIENRVHFVKNETHFYLRLNLVYEKYLDRGKKRNINCLDYQTLESYLINHPSFDKEACEKGRNTARKTFDKGRYKANPFKISMLEGIKEIFSS